MGGSGSPCFMKLQSSLQSRQQSLHLKIVYLLPERSGRGQRVLPGRGVLQTWVISLCSLGPHAFLGSGPRLFLHVGELPFLKQPLHFRGLQQRTVIPSLTLTAMLQCRYHFHPQGTEERSMAQRRGGISSRALTVAGCRMAPPPPTCPRPIPTL